MIYQVTRFIEDFLSKDNTSSYAEISRQKILKNFL